MTPELTTELLKTLNLSIGDFNEDETMNEYYEEKITTAYEDLISDDISKVRLESDLGKKVIVLYATILLNDMDISTNNTLNMMRQKLSIMTWGDEVEDA